LTAEEEKLLKDLAEKKKKAAVELRKKVSILDLKDYH